MKKIKLTQGKYAIVDNDDYDILNAHKWCYDGGYAHRKVRINGKDTKIYMHRFISNTPTGFETDHINRDRLDNRKENLRVCTRSQNSVNKLKQSNNTSGYKGVSFHKRLCKFRAYIMSNGTESHLGYFSNINEAAKAYNKKATELYGEFAYINKLERN